MFVANGMNVRRVFSVTMAAAAMALGMAGTASAQGPGVGIKGGVVFPNFNSDAFDLKKRTGWQAGVWFGGNREGVVGVQGEVNLLRKRAESDIIPDATVDITYLQIPVLLRLHNPSSSAAGAQLYGIVGPSFDLKLSETLEGINFTDDAFKRLDIGLMFGVGVEAGRFLVEGRYTRGLRDINEELSVTEIKSHSFAVLAGVRFN